MYIPLQKWSMVDLLDCQINFSPQQHHYCQQIQGCWDRSKSPILETSTKINLYQQGSGFLQLCPSLVRRNSGPYKVLQRTEKFYRLELRGKTDTVSWTGLKPAFIEPTESKPTLHTFPPKQILPPAEATPHTQQPPSSTPATKLLATPATTPI